MASPKYGSLDISEQIAKRRRHKSLIVPTDDASLSDDEVKEFGRQTLIRLARNSPSDTARIQAAKELWERVEPKKDKPDAQISAGDIKKLNEIYDRIFAQEIVIA